jgi:hypothetical protein
MTRRTIADLSGFLLRHGVVIAPSGFGCLATATEQADLDYLITAVDAYLTRLTEYPAAVRRRIFLISAYPRGPARTPPDQPISGIRARRATRPGGR